MKKLLFIAPVIFIMSCQISSKTDVESLKKNLTYFKDNTTGLCFASVNSTVESRDISSITCVPCDSLIKIGIK